MASAMYIRNVASLQRLEVIVYTVERARRVVVQGQIYEGYGKIWWKRTEPNRDVYGDIQRAHAGPREYWYYGNDEAKE